METSPPPIQDDTIAAIATAVGGAIAVIRISGPDALDYGQAVWRGACPLAACQPRQLQLGSILDADGYSLDKCLAVYFPAPASYTGEHMVELHCHGGIYSARAVLMRVLDVGARAAEPGEFTKRAFLNGKMDLTQAEAVADIISAHTKMALHLANCQMDGALGQRINGLYDQVLDVLSEAESRMDFPEEDLDWVDSADLQQRLTDSLNEINRLLEFRREGEILRHGVRLVIAGHPNVGKSSLMNAILGRDRAIVTHLPGTTRDTLEELAHIRGIPVRLIDTAGIRDAENIIEQSGIERSWASIRQAQVVVWVFDVGRPFDKQIYPPQLEGPPVVLVGNKIDKLSDTPSDDVNTSVGRPVYTCALSGEGMEALYDAIERAVWNRPHGEELDTAVSARHAQLLELTRRGIEDACEHLQHDSWEVVAFNLREALDAIGRISGRTVAPDILDTIFSRFCVGK
ncbi:MAG: tRNA uridine-5-carboxymethylaminomethyl(34) synthesis GTPase MnmE [Candidatus Pacebacteria bacterium]|nr:tRNA uridine-5-carboxymethylaminomethyl(34) synthesis GTPase MnmE [Candidatus Paceibacterota bacterium]